MQDGSAATAGGPSRPHQDAVGQPDHFPWEYLVELGAPRRIERHGLHLILPRPPATKLAYLFSVYPTLEHSYLLREVRQLRELGWNIQTISIRQPGERGPELSPAEQEEFRSTWYVLSSSVFTHTASHAFTLATRPLRYLRGLATAWKLGGFNPRQLFLATAYFCEAVCTGYRMRQAGIQHVHSVYSTTVALILSRVFDIHLSMTLHGSAEFVNPVGFWIREKVRTAETVCGISQFGKSQIMLSSDPTDWAKVKVTPLGVDIVEWRPRVFRDDPSPFELLSVGRLVETKGFPLLLDAVAKLRAEGREIRLTLVGDGPDRVTLEARAYRLGISDRVVFAGWKSQDELREIYGSADLCVLTSFAEGLPVVLMEAMATGVPCVAPRLAGIPELIRDGIDGLLFTPSNMQELVGALGQLIDDPRLRRRMGESSREQITDKYDLLKNAMHLSDIFRHWIAPGSAGTPSATTETVHEVVAN